MRVIFIVQLPIEGPSSRYRVYQFLPYLQQQGVETTVVPFIDSTQIPVIYNSGNVLGKIAITLGSAIKRVGELLQSGSYDIAYIVREAFPFGPPFFETLFHRRVGKMIFDFDDAIYTPSVAYNNPLDALRDWQKTDKLIKTADHVVVGSRYLANYALNLGLEPKAVSVIPTVVDTSVFVPRNDRSTSDKIIVGWIGTPRGTAYLRQLMPVFSDLAARHANLRFVFVGAEPFDVQGLPIEFKTWQLEEEIADVQSFDIGIMPLTDDEESRGKCGFKLIQYMSVGIPSVCSPIGANLEIIEEGRSGYFAGNHEEWREKLSLLIEQHSQRVDMGHNGRVAAVQAFSLASAGPQLLSVLEKVMRDTGSA